MTSKGTKNYQPIYSHTDNGKLIPISDNVTECPILFKNKSYNEAAEKRKSRRNKAVYCDDDQLKRTVAIQQRLKLKLKNRL
jgi:hypothetical protein